MNIASIEYAIILVGLFVLGSVFGSLMNVCIYRLPREERFWRALRFMVYPPSHCPRCREKIRFYDNIPIFGWLLLRGRCRNCQGAISLRYPLIEGFTGLLFAAVYCFEIPDWWGNVLAHSSAYHVFGPQGVADSTWLSPIAILHWRYAVHMALVLALLVAAFIDIDLRIIPDAVTLPAMAIGLVANGLLGQVYIAPVWYQTPGMAAAGGMFSLMFEGLFPAGTLPGWLMPGFTAGGVPAWIAAHPHLHGLALSVAGIIVGGGGIWTVRLVGQWTLKREAMGFGDVILMAMIGSFVGWQGTLIVFVFSLAAAVLVAVPMWFVWRDHELPYGPYLSLGALLLLVTARPVWPWFDDRVFALGPMLLPMALFMATALAGLLFVWRRVQNFLGLAPVDSPVFEESWLPGDQLAYLASACSDDRQGQWPRCDWPGRRAGRGQEQQHIWRCGDCCRPDSGWQKPSR